MILFHNHPSGVPFPSPQDIAITRDIVDAGKLVDVAILDHLIIGRDAVLSLKRTGHM